MKEIKAYIKPFKVMDVVQNLNDNGFSNIPVLKAEGTGAFKDSSPEISTEFAITDSQVAKIELVCDDGDEGKIVGIITEYARTGEKSDGIIYVSDVNRVYRVKDGLKNGK